MEQREVEAIESPLIFSYPFYYAFSRNMHMTKELTGLIHRLRFQGPEGDRLFGPWTRMTYEKVVVKFGGFTLVFLVWWAWDLELIRLGSWVWHMQHGQDILCGKEIVFCS